jgi:hypothetical protein
VYARAQAENQKTFERSRRADFARAVLDRRRLHEPDRNDDPLSRESAMNEKQFRAFLMTTVAAVGALAATNAMAWKSPTKARYMTGPLEICDKGTFYVGGNPKISPFANGPTPSGNRQIIINQMYVQFQTPMKSKSWPVIMVHGSGYSGSAVEGTAAGNEGWNDYLVRNGIPSYVVDQPGRGRSGFDHTPIHEAVNKLQNNDVAGALALLPGGGVLPQFGFSHEGTAGFAAWFGHYLPGPSGNADHDVTQSRMIRHGEADDPLCATEPAHCTFKGRLPMEGDSPWAIDDAIKSRAGIGAPSGIGTVTADNAQVAENASYLALEAYKFDLPNTENFLPASTCSACNPTTVNATNTWTPIALAELVEGLGGAIVATHSQSGSIGHHMTRILKERGKLHLLKGLITFEGSCSFAVSGLALDGSDFKNIPYMALKSDYTNFSQGCQDSVNAIKAIGGKADYIQLDEPGFWQGSYKGPFGPNYVGPFRGTSHMAMIEDNPAPTGSKFKKGKATNLQVMDVILGWADRNIRAPRTTYCSAGDHGHGHGK